MLGSGVIPSDSRCRAFSVVDVALGVMEDESEREGDVALDGGSAVLSRVPTQVISGMAD